MLAVWAAALALVLGVFLARDHLPWAVNYPAGAVVPATHRPWGEPKAHVAACRTTSAATRGIVRRGTRADRVMSGAGLVPLHIERG